MDREADFFELFDAARTCRHKAHLIVRAQYNRRLVGEQRKLFSFVKSKDPNGHIDVSIPRQRMRRDKRGAVKRPNRRARQAKLAVWYKQVTLAPPETSTCRSLDPVTLYAIVVEEQNSPQGAAKISWKLLTSLPIENLDDELAKILEFQL